MSRDVAGEQPEPPNPTRRTFRRAGRPPAPPGTPPEIAASLVWETRTPLELPRLTKPPFSVKASTTKHRLVVIGDSISHGFKSFAICDTAMSWPAMVAGYGGIEGFRFPRYGGPPACPGLPLNLESVLRGNDWPASLLDFASDFTLMRSLHSMMDEVEDWWERGPGADLVDAAPARGDREINRVNHNLACWGFDVRDALSVDVDLLRYRVSTAAKQGDNLLNQLPSAAGERSALLSLAGGVGSDTQLSLAEALGADGGIETLVIALGANNVLSSVLDFQVRWSGDDFADVDAKAQYNVWRPAHFAIEFDALLEQAQRIAAEKVVVLTVPHVTIAPMVRGVGSKMPGDRYFARYTRPWIPDDVFNPNRHPCLTGDQLRVLDFAVDQYNDHIVRQVQSLDSAEQRWTVLDIAGVLDRLAYRRYLIDGEAQPGWWKPYDLPAEYLSLSPQPDTRFYRADRFGRIEGGLFSLDGVHPTTSGYALVAREVMQQLTALGVRLDRSEPDYEAVFAGDTLFANPPGPTTTVLNIVEFCNRAADLYQALHQRPPI